MSNDMTLLVEGMTCQHCVGSVTTAVTALPGVQSVSIELVPEGRSALRVETAEELSRDTLVDAVAEAGYTVVDD
jgi:copper chaperone